jgi:hypothetical protein
MISKDHRSLFLSRSIDEPKGEPTTTFGNIIDYQVEPEKPMIGITD